jgi:hypothetical protein
VFDDIKWDVHKTNPRFGVRTNPMTPKGAFDLDSECASPLQPPVPTLAGDNTGRTNSLPTRTPSRQPPRPPKRHHRSGARPLPRRLDNGGHSSRLRPRGPRTPHAREHDLVHRPPRV